MSRLSNGTGLALSILVSVFLSKPDKLAAGPRRASQMEKPGHPRGFRCINALIRRAKRKSWLEINRQEDPIR